MRGFKSLNLGEICYAALGSWYKSHMSTLSLQPGLTRQASESAVLDPPARPSFRYLQS